MTHNPEIREKLAERIKKEKEHKFKPAYLPDEEFDKKALEQPKSVEGKRARRHSWRERLGISNKEVVRESHIATADEPLKICKECGEEATDMKQVYCEICGSKL
jgi:hypothetical protein